MHHVKKRKRIFALSQRLRRLCLLYTYCAALTSASFELTSGYSCASDSLCNLKWSQPLWKGVLRGGFQLWSSVASFELLRKNSVWKVIKGSSDLTTFWIRFVICFTPVGLDTRIHVNFEISVYKMHALIKKMATKRNPPQKPNKPKSTQNQGR